MEQRYEFSLGALLTEVRERLKWADGKALKNEMDKQVKFLSKLEHSIQSIDWFSYSNSWVQRIVHQNQMHRLMQQWLKDRIALQVK